MERIRSLSNDSNRKANPATWHPLARMAPGTTGILLWATACIKAVTLIAGIPASGNSEVAEAPLIRLHGHVTVYAHPAEDKTRPFITYDFLVYLRDTQWAVELNNMRYHHPRGGGPSRVQYSGDGSSFYLVKLWGGESVKRTEDYLKSKGDQGRLQAFRGFSGESARARAGNYPRDLWNSDAAPWIAYCSAPLFRNAEDGRIPNIFYKFAWPINSVPFVLEVGDSLNPDFPQNMHLYKPMADRRSARGRTGPGIEKDEPRLHLGLQHTVLEWRRELDTYYPARFVQRVHDKVLRGDREIDILSSEIHGILHGVEIIEATTPFVPALMPETSISDRRTHIGQRSLVYQAGSTGWLDPDDPELDAHVNRIREDLLERYSPTRRKNRPLTMLMFVLLASLPFIWLLIRACPKTL
jgi:hypothetical protein